MSASTSTSPSLARPSTKKRGRTSDTNNSNDEVQEEPLHKKQCVAAAAKFNPNSRYRFDSVLKAWAKGGEDAMRSLIQKQDALRQSQ